MALYLLFNINYPLPDLPPRGKALMKGILSPLGEIRKGVVDLKTISNLFQNFLYMSRISVVFGRFDFQYSADEIVDVDIIQLIE